MCTSAGPDPRCRRADGVTNPTSATVGYYYANWNVTSDVDVRVQFLSTDANVKNTWKYIRVVDVR